MTEQMALVPVALIDQAIVNMTNAKFDRVLVRDLLRCSLQPAPHPPTREQIAGVLRNLVTPEAQADAVLALIENGSDRG